MSTRWSLIWTQSPVSPPTLKALTSSLAVSSTQLFGIYALNHLTSLTSHLNLSTAVCFTFSFSLFQLCPLQATIAQCACGCWTTGHACRRSQLIGRSTMRPFTTWRSTRPSPLSPVLAQTHLPRSLSDTAPIILVITHNPTQRDAHSYFSEDRNICWMRQTF